MGCSPSTALAHHSGKEPLTCTNVFIDSQNIKYQQAVNSLDSENNNNNNNNNTSNHKLDQDNNNSVNNKLDNRKHNKEEDSEVLDNETDSAKIIPVIANEERTHLSSQSPPFNVHMLTRPYGDSDIANDSLTHARRKSVLKTRVRRDHVLSNRPLKSVKFLDSVTVITVF